MCVFLYRKDIVRSLGIYSRVFVFMKSNIRYNIRSSVAHLAHMTAACFTKFLCPSPLYQFQENITRKGGGSWGKAANHTQTDRRKGRGRRAERKKGNIFTHFQLNRKWKSRRGKRLPSPRERATIITLFLSTQERGEQWEEYYIVVPTCQPQLLS